MQPITSIHLNKNKFGMKRHTVNGLSPLTRKDKCYYKVKRQYKVFPSAYASGAVAKCRKNS
jgi:hypothetical protein